MATKLSKGAISELMAWWGHKGGSRATVAQKNAARANLKKTPNYQKHVQLRESTPCEQSSVHDCGAPEPAVMDEE